MYLIYCKYIILSFVKAAYYYYQRRISDVTRATSRNCQTTFHDFLMRHFIFPKCHFLFPKCHFCHRKVPFLKKTSGTRLSATANQHFISDKRELSTAYYIIVDNSFNSLIYNLDVSTNRCLYMFIRLFAHGLYTHLSTIQVISCIHA